MPVIVFDLDDTLYDELTFVRSGFKAVAAFLEEQKGIPAEQSYADMLERLERDGRGKVFDAVLQEYDCYSKRLAARCVAVYRAHRPDIRLFPDAEYALETLGAYPLYIVTDGNKHVQWNKLQALGLAAHPNIRRCFVTRRFGIRREKPSPYCFGLICRAERTEPRDVVYVGDNPNKDFVGIKPLGYRTVRIRRGSYAGLRKPAEYEAEHEIDDLTELIEYIRRIYG
jgi:putative hydrolase of the HAD superfamily